MKKILQAITTTMLLTLLACTLIGCAENAQTKTVHYEGISFEVPEDFTEEAVKDGIQWKNPDATLSIQVESLPSLPEYAPNSVIEESMRSMPVAFEIYDAGEPAQSEVDGHTVFSYDNLSCNDRIVYIRGVQTDQVIFMFIQGTPDHAEELEEIANSYSIE